MSTPNKQSQIAGAEVLVALLLENASASDMRLLLKLYDLADDPLGVYTSRLSYMTGWPRSELLAARARMTGLIEPCLPWRLTDVGRVVLQETRRLLVNRA